MVGNVGIARVIVEAIIGIEVRGHGARHESDRIRQNGRLTQDLVAASHPHRIAQNVVPLESQTIGKTPLDFHLETIVIRVPGGAVNINRAVDIGVIIAQRHRRIGSRRERQSGGLIVYKVAGLPVLLDVLIEVPARGSNIGRTEQGIAHDLRLERHV